MVTGKRLLCVYYLTQLIIVHAVSKQEKILNPLTPPHPPPPSSGGKHLLIPLVMRSFSIEALSS